MDEDGFTKGCVAQLVEQRTENPRVVRSIRTAAIIKNLYLQGLGCEKIAKTIGLSYSGVKKYAHKLGIIDKNRIPKSKFDTHEAVELYKKGYGCYRISKIFGVHESSVRRRLKKVITLDPSRVCKKKEGSRRNRRTSKHDFRESLKRKIFEKRKGYCEICLLLIGDGKNFKQALYHHKIPVSRGGNSTEENCMVVHPECHKKNFYKLHGFNIYYENSYERFEKRKKKERNEKLENEAILKLFNGGLKISEIEEKLKLGRTCVITRLLKMIESGKISKELYELRKKERPPKNEKITDEQVIELKNKGMNAKRIACELEVNERTVFYRLRNIKNHQAIEINR